MGLETSRQLRQGCGEFRRNPSKCVEIRRKYPLQITFPKNQVFDPISACNPLSPVMFGVWLAPRRIWDASGRARRNPSKPVEIRRNPSKVSFADHFCRNRGFHDVSALDTGSYVILCARFWPKRSNVVSRNMYEGLGPHGMSLCCLQEYNSEPL